MKSGFINKRKIVFIICMFLSISLTGCYNGVGRYNRKADNPVAEKVFDTFGKHDIYYEGSKEAKSSEFIIYNFCIKKYDKETIHLFIDCVNEETLIKNKKTCVCLMAAVNNGVAEPVLALFNYNGDYIYDGFKLLTINYPPSINVDLFKDPMTYEGIKNIHFLKVKKEFKKIAEEEKIDWYSLFPDLESQEYFD